ncbi:2,3-diaminopropionate biosynthesis protein SbnA [Kutzneria buriramensis]|uniref:Cysteine synthase A n=1 Tax=Kutzneria buriramensis TaxID=1045776 RepID=A0A3E0GUX8_9PSEU|nr:2,3-diaminopropionate biosynthesis protein SbnA [Kutzneria buriramensis]REH26968.1 cysteine synthase A [Kutzneria buriramensis]
MPIISSPVDFNADDVYLDLRASLAVPLLIKCEGFNFARSIKLKAASEMVAAAERDGTLTAGSTIVESSSGNLGVALSVIAASRGYHFICVTDVRCTASSQRAMEALGTEVHVIREPAPVGGFLEARLEQVRTLCAENPEAVWLDQYHNENNWGAHYRRTGPALLRAFPGLDVLFVGAGTAGTLMGCARYLRDAGSSATVVAVDAAGSVTFGGPSGVRMIPGLGAGVRPALLDESYVDEVVIVEEQDTVRTCRALAAKGMLFGGSTGTVVGGAIRWLADHRDGRDVTAVAIAPDFGESYLDSVYDDGWTEEFGLAPRG